MTKAAGIQTSFNGGELSPLIAGRVDVAKFANGCERMENFLPTIQGPAISRPGFRYVAEVKDSADQTWLVRFEFSVEEAYQLEFGDQYIRFYTNRGQLQTSGVAAYNGATAYTVGDLVTNAGTTYYCIAATTGNAPPNATYWYAQTGTIYEIPSPYTAAELTNDDGTLALRYAQTGDVVYLVHPNHPPYKLSRFAATDWTLATVEFNPPPFKALNSTTTTIYAGATTGATNLTASAAVFTASMVGQYIYLGEKDVRDGRQWEVGVAIALGNNRRSNGRNYEALNAATTGTIRPTHTEGAAYDGNTGVQWQYLDAGYGWALITGFTSATSVAATVVSRLPTGAVGVADPTTRWALQAWNDDDGWPTTVAFYRERLVFGRDDTLWFSVSADFENFSFEVDGLVTADAGFDRTLASDRVNSIRWLSPGDVLLVGTLGDEWAVVEATTSDPFGPGNCKAQRQSTYGSSNVMPARVGDVTLFVQKAGRKVRAMAFRFEEDGFKSDDVTVFASHITSPRLVDMAFQQEPYSVVWGARSDGVLVGMTMSREQDVVAWHRHPMTGATVECVESIPSPDGGRDDLWIIAKYTIDGVTKRYIAYLEEESDLESSADDQEDWFYVDMGATYDGAATDTITGLDYLEGEEVWVLADGARHPNRTVTGGEITLQVEASKVQVGLPNIGVLETMQLDIGATDGTSQGKIKRVHFMVARVLRSLGGIAGPSDGRLEELQYRSPSVPMGTAPPPFTGDIPVEWPGDYDRKQTVVIQRDRPMPINVVAVMPTVVTENGR